MKTRRWYKAPNGMTIEASLKEMALYQTSKQKLLLCGHVYYSGRVPYLHEVVKSFQNHELVVLCENGATTYDRIDGDNYPHLSREDKEQIKFFLVPDMFIKDSFHEYQGREVTARMKLRVGSTPYLREASENLKKRHFNMGKGYAENFACDAEDYINGILNILAPQIVVIWNQFYAFHHILGAICKKRGIKVIYYEFGVLPGTYALETRGQMGESYPAKCSEEFRNLPVSEDELSEARRVWDFLKISKLNRKKQPVNDELSLLKQRLIADKPTIFFAGQNDYESGIIPYTKSARKNHSPIFGSSDIAARELASICKKNGWNFIYKRHPLVACFARPEKMPDNVLMFDNIDIAEVIETADVTMTILSQVGYVSTILKKPTIMLGYMQLKGKGCTYEAFARGEVEDIMKEALREGFTGEQQEAFIRHIAQLNKYYLFNDPYVERELYFGRGTEQCKSFFLEQMNEASVQKYDNSRICNRALLLVNMYRAINGRKVWRKIYDSWSINLVEDHIVVIPWEDKISQYYAMLYMDKFLDRLHKKSVILVTDSKQVCDTIGLFTQRLKGLVSITTKQMNELLKYHIVFGNAEIATIASVYKYTGRMCEGLIGKENIDVEEAIAVGVYDLSYFYHSLNKRMENIGKTYLQLYFPELSGRSKKMDVSQLIKLTNDMVSKRGVMSLMVSGNVAHLSIYANKIGKMKNATGIVIPKEYAPAKDVMAIASSSKGKNYMVTIKNNGELWFNFYDEQSCPVLVNSTWII